MKLKLLSLSLALLAIASLWSCGPNENQVTIDIVANQEFPKRGETVELTVTASGDLENLKSVNVEVNTVDTNGATLNLLSSTADAADLSYSGTFSFTIANGSKIGEAISIVVTVKDAIDGSFEKINESVIPVQYMSVYRANAIVGHQFGPLNGGFNLVEAIEAFKDAPNNTKDMVDRSEQKKDLSYTFGASSESNTQYVDLGKDFDIATLHTVLAAETFTKRAPSTIITVSEGTKFLAKLRGGVDYAVVHIKTIEPDFEQQPTENKGRYTFDVYKLQ